MYPTDGGTIWLWQGGETSINVSPWMEPDFFRPPAADSAGNETAWGYNYTQSCSSHDFAIFGNNWCCDTVHVGPEGLPGWWRYENPSDYVIHKTTSDWKGRKFYGARSGYVTSDDPVLFEYDWVTRAHDYSWQSHPMADTIERAKQARGLAVTLVGAGTAKMTVTTAQDPVGETITFTSDDPTRAVRRRSTDIAVQGTHHQVRIEAEGLSADDPAPDVHVAAIARKDIYKT